MFETRILVSEPSKSDWRAQTSYSKKEVAVGGYEIRRRDWQTFGDKMARHNKREWDSKTVYVVRAFIQLFDETLTLEMNRKEFHPSSAQLLACVGLWDLCPAGCTTCRTSRCLLTIWTTRVTNRSREDSDSSPFCLQMLSNLC